MNVHAKSRLNPEPLRALRPEDKGQAGACPDRTRAIPYTVQAVVSSFQGPEYTRNAYSNRRDERSNPRWQNAESARLQRRLPEP